MKRAFFVPLHQDSKTATDKKGAHLPQSRNYCLPLWLLTEGKA